MQEQDNSEENLEENENNDIVGDNNNTGTYSINGEGRYNQSHLCTHLVKYFIEAHPEMSAEEVKKKWLDLGKIAPHFIETQAMYDRRTDKSKDAVNGLPCNGEKIYLATNVWTRQRIDKLIDSIPQDWNLKVEKLQQ